MIFSIVFAIEMILKIIGEGRKYLNDPLNIFDAIIVVLRYCCCFFLDGEMLLVSKLIISNLV